MDKKDKMEIESEAVENAAKKIVYYAAAGNLILVEAEKERQKELIKDILRKTRGNWKRIFVSSKRKDWEVESLLVGSNGFFKGIIFGILPKDRILIIEDGNSISEDNMKKIRYFYDENNIKSAIIITEDSSIIKDFPDAIKSRIGNRIVRLK